MDSILANWVNNFPTKCLLVKQVRSKQNLRYLFDFLIGRKHSRKDRQVKVSFRDLKAQIYWPTTDQKVRGSNPCGRTGIADIKLLKFSRTFN